MSISRRRYIGLHVTDDEYDRLAAAVLREGTTMADFLRRCVNDALLDQGIDRLLYEREYNPAGMTAYRQARLANGRFRA